MRSIINISLPNALDAAVDREVKRGKYASKSEFFRDLLRLWREEQLLRELRDSQRDIARGKGKILRSLKDLRTG